MVPLSLTKRLSLPYLAGWIMFGAMQTVVLHRLGWAWPVSATDAAVSTALLALVSLSTRFIFSVYQPGKENRMYRFAYALVMAILFVAALQMIMARLLAGNVAYLHFLEQSVPVRFIFAWMVVSFITLITWLMHILSTQKEMERRQQEAEQLMKEAELTRLRQQLQPHFLFNSLNSINALIGIKPQEARTMTQQLSDFLRGTLRKEDSMVQLREELDHLHLYLSIEKVRFGNRLAVVFETAPETLAMTLPGLLVQPIVENAIKFGLYDVTETVEILIKTSISDGFLVIEIRNPFDPETKSAHGGVGFGLASIRRRLQLIYSRPDLLQTQASGSTFVSTLKIPAL